MGSLVDRLVERGEIGGRTVQIVASGEVECARYPVAPLVPGHVRVRTLVTAISPGTELTFIGREATNVYLRKSWDPELRLFVAGTPALDHPVVFGYRAAGEVVESAEPGLPAGTRLFGRWRHTEFTMLSAADARAQRLPAGLALDDAVDLAQMAPIAVNAVAFADGAHAGAPAVVFGAGPVGLMVAQIARADGATPVYVVDRLPGRLAIAERLGLRPVHATDDDVAARLKRAHPERIGVAFECTGSARALHEAIRVVRRRGIVAAVGFYQGEAAGLFLGDEFHHNGVRLVSAQIGNVHPEWDLERLRRRAIELASSGALVLGGLPRLVVPVEEVARGFDALRRPDEVLQVALSYASG